jgi:putative membrane protein
MGADGGAMAGASDGGAMSNAGHDMSNAASSAGSAASNAGSAAADSASQAGQAAADAGSSAWNATKDTASSAATTASDAAKNAGSSMGMSDGGSSSDNSSGSMSSSSSDGGTMTGAGSSMGSGGSSGGQLSDGQIAQIAMTANNVEITAARAAVKATKNARVKEFAREMIKDHTAANTQAQALAKKAGISPEESDTSQQLNQHGQDEMQQLKGLKGAQFDRAYIDAQVQDHQTVLDALDNQLIPNAKNDDMKSLLTKVRTKVSQHLEHARSLQQSMGGGTTGGSASR